MRAVLATSSDDVPATQPMQVIITSENDIERRQLMFLMKEAAAGVGFYFEGYFYQLTRSKDQRGQTI